MNLIEHLQKLRSLNSHTNTVDKSFYSIIALIMRLNDRGHSEMTLLHFSMRERVEYVATSHNVYCTCVIHEVCRRLQDEGFVVTGRLICGTSGRIHPRITISWEV